MSDDGALAAGPTGGLPPLRVWEHSPRDGAQGASERPAVVLVHGAMDRSASFARAVRALPERRVIRYDRRGYGHSQRGGPAVGIAGHAADLAVLIERRGGGPVVAIGHSLGGLVALAAATQRPELFAAVGCYEAPMPWESWWPRDGAGNAALAAADGDRASDAAERFLRRMIGDERWETLGEAVREQRRAEGSALVAELRSAAGGPPYDLARVLLPVSSARGTEGAVHHHWAADALARAISPPDGRAYTIAGADHGAHLSHPEQFAAWIRGVVAAAVAFRPSVAG